MPKVCKWFCMVWMVYCTIWLIRIKNLHGFGGINSIGLWCRVILPCEESILLIQNNTWCKQKFSVHGTEEGEKGMTIWLRWSPCFKPGGPFLILIKVKNLFLGCLEWGERGEPLCWTPSDPMVALSHRYTVGRGTWVSQRSRSFVVHHL